MTMNLLVHRVAAHLGVLSLERREQIARGLGRIRRALLPLQSTGSPSQRLSLSHEIARNSLMRRSWERLEQRSR